MSETVKRHAEAREKAARERQLYQEKLSQANALTEDARRLSAEAFAHKREAESWEKAAASHGVVLAVEAETQKAQEARAAAEELRKAAEKQKAEVGEQLESLKKEREELAALLAQAKAEKKPE